jgi:hypothetical protein
MKTLCVALGLIAGFLVGSLWSSVAQPAAIAQTVRPDGSGAAAGDLCDGRWEVDPTFNPVYRYRCNGTLIPALSAPVYLASRSLRQLETLNAIEESVDEVRVSVDRVRQAVNELNATLQKQSAAANAEPQPGAGR